MAKIQIGDVIRDMTAEELASIQPTFEDKISILRMERDALLNQTDWIVTKAKETGITIPTAWKTYRQALRDITEGLTTVEEINAVVFPTKP